MNFDTYLADLPLLHTWDQGKTWTTGGFKDFHLREFAKLAKAAAGKRGKQNPSILETGAGNSTLTFLFAEPERLISIAPDADLVERIGSWCRDNGVNTSAWSPIIDRSEIALPAAALREREAGNMIDLALLDGGHGWPTVFVDFCYANALLKKGGIILVDDVQLHSVKELARQLVKQPEFQLVQDLGKVLAFEKQVDEAFLRDFNSQPYIKEQNARNQELKNPFEL